MIWRKSFLNPHQIKPCVLSHFLVKKNRRTIHQQRRNQKRKKTKRCKLTDGLTAEERALDYSSNNGDNNRGPPQQSNKGKRKASNSYNFNPKSRGTPGMFFLSHFFVIPLLELTIRKFLGNFLIINPFPSTYAFLSDLKTWSLLVMSTSAIDVANYKRDFGLRDRRKGVGITVGNIWINNPVLLLTCHAQTNVLFLRLLNKY